MRFISRYQHSNIPRKNNLRWNVPTLASLLGINNSFKNPTTSRQFTLCVTCYFSNLSICWNSLWRHVDLLFDIVVLKIKNSPIETTKIDTLELHEMKKLAKSLHMSENEIYFNSFQYYFATWIARSSTSF